MSPILTKRIVLRPHTLKHYVFFSLTSEEDVNEDAVSTAKDEFSSPQSHLAIPSLLKALLSISWENYVIGAVMQILETACLFTNPLILR